MLGIMSCCYYFNYLSEYFLSNLHQLAVWFSFVWFRVCVYHLFLDHTHTHTHTHTHRAWKNKTSLSWWIFPTIYSLHKAWDQDTCWTPQLLFISHTTLKYILQRPFFFIGIRKAIWRDDIFVWGRLIDFPKT